MGTKVKVLIVIIALSMTISLMSNTYSRYVAGTTGSVEATFAKWQILVNNNDITTNAASNVAITPTILENPHVKANTIAPSSQGYFDIKIDPTNVDVSFDYTVSLALENTNMPDIMITKYSTVDNEGIESELQVLNDTEIIGSLLFNNEIENFVFEAFSIRVYFEWYEGVGEQMDDAIDTAIGTDENATFKINATITFNQKL